MPSMSKNLFASTMTTNNYTSPINIKSPTFSRYTSSRSHEITNSLVQKVSLSVTRSRLANSASVFKNRNVDNQQTASQSFCRDKSFREADDSESSDSESLDNESLHDDAEIFSRIALDVGEYRNYTY